jgi:mannosyltransferase OCH1-like enzyme
MQKLTLSRRPYTKTMIRLFICAICLSVAVLWFLRHLLYKSWTLAAVPFIWHANASSFILSDTNDAFDITFANYSQDQLSAAPYENVVPPILHHIALGMDDKDWREDWREAVQSCIDMHRSWKSYIWTDKTAEKFVAEKFPELLDIWKGYRFPVERVDALRYMVLYEYGGIILDMDLKCRRALGPLRRFKFVAPEAYPTGFSIGFMMASKQNTFIREIVDNLATYDIQWLLPYATVMFSTGCHYASVIHTRQENRADLKILPGPLHSLNGRVLTPIFEHLGSSSWHSYDARYITTLGKMPRLIFIPASSVILALLLRKRKSFIWRCAKYPKYIVT